METINTLLVCGTIIVGMTIYAAFLPSWLPRKWDAEDRTNLGDILYMIPWIAILFFIPYSRLIAAACILGAFWICPTLGRKMRKWYVAR